MTAKEEKLYSFYSQCIEKGYTDMSDETQSLKAKVIATDLGLRYGKIASFFEEAKNVFEREEERKKTEEKAAALEAARVSVPGELVVTLRENPDKKDNSIDIYRRPDGSVYCKHNGNEKKYEGAPDIEVRKGGVLSYTYHPSKTVFTGASSGGVAMGGFHQTEAYTTEKVSGTGKGDIHAKSGDMNIWVKYIDFSDSTDMAFRRDETYNSLKQGKRIVCIDTSNASFSRDIIGMAIQNRGGYQDVLAKASMAADLMKLPMGQIQQIAGFLNDVIAGNYPKTDEEYYKIALTLSDSAKSDDLLKAVQTFQKISDYKDSSDRAKLVQKRYEEVLQEEKEQKIIEKEQRERKLKKRIVIAAPLVVVSIVVGMLISSSMKKRATYNSAELLLQEKRYAEAVEIFESLNGYKDSDEKIQECKYQAAVDVVNLLESDNPNTMDEGVRLRGDFEPEPNVKRIASAYAFFASTRYKNAYMELEMLGSYEDCETILDCLDKEENAVNTMYESFAKAAPLVEALPENNKMKESLSNTISEYEPYMGSFYWMNSKNMKFDSDFKLDKSDYGVVRWTNAQITVKLDGKNVPYPLVVLDGKNYGLLEDLAFNDLKAKGNIQDLFDVNAEFRDGIAAVDMYYKSGEEMKLGDTFFACSDDPESKKFGEKYYKSQNESVKMDLAKHYFRCAVYGKTKTILDELSDSADKTKMLSTVEHYLPYLGTWEFLSGDAALIADDYMSTRTEVTKIQTETSWLNNKVNIDIYRDGVESKALKSFTAEGDEYVCYRANAYKKPKLKFILTITDTGNLLITEEKDGKRFTAEYKRTGNPGEGTPVVLTKEAMDLEAKTEGTKKQSSSNTPSNTSGSSHKPSSSSKTASSSGSLGSTTEKVKCSMCNGTGQVEYYYGESALEAALNGQNDYELGPCTSCNGTGYVTVKTSAGSASSSSNKKTCPSCGNKVSNLVTKKDVAGVNRTWCSNCWNEYNAIMGK